MYLRYLLLVLIFSGLFINDSFAYHTEIFNGNYSYKDKNLAIKFDLDNSGVKNLKINARVFKENLTYDYLGNFGNTLVFGITVEENQYLYDIMLCIYHTERKVLFVSGYYALLEYNSNDVDFIIKHQKTIEMVFMPVTESK